MGLGDRKAGTPKQKKQKLANTFRGLATDQPSEVNQQDKFYGVETLSLSTRTNVNNPDTQRFPDTLISALTTKRRFLR